MGRVLETADDERTDHAHGELGADVRVVPVRALRISLEPVCERLFRLDRALWEEQERKKKQFERLENSELSVAYHAKWVR